MTGIAIQLLQLRLHAFIGINTAFGMNYEMCIEHSYFYHTWIDHNVQVDEVSVCPKAVS